VALSGISTHVGTPNRCHVSASKSGLEGLMRALAVELAPHKIRVNAVAPGFIVTEMTRKHIEESGLFGIWTNNTPAARLGEPQEVAYGMLYLASDAASFVTGSILVIDGGYTCW